MGETGCRLRDEEGGGGGGLGRWLRNVVNGAGEVKKKRDVSRLKE